MTAIKTTSTGKNVLRLFIALWFLLGWMSHVYLVVTNPEGYRGFGNTALIPVYTTFWNEFVMPNITVFAILLILFEITVGCLISSSGKWVKIGLVFSILFSLFLIQMGLSDTTADIWSNFAINRLPNSIFIALQIPLFWGDFKQSLPMVIKGWFSKNGK
ncbi:MAG: hypothetical protein CVU43_06380 [Chloroflexi bacterium HGW-Chloroflexi-5]|jgi:hypothetical protein|nr:MAG: hypothetical protein CVU43_06380 [Chloroflexi bacterium HGW-Chloroflexi-5]